MINFKEILNKDQYEAVIAINQPVRIIAGAGSGKTRVIIYKIAYLIEEKNYDPKTICALTFTNKAANEMKSKICKLLDVKTINSTISTYHSFATKILTRDISKLKNSKYRYGFSIIDNKDKDRIISKILKSIPKEDFEKTAASNYNKAISSLKNTQEPNFDEYEKNIHSLKLIREIYKLYEEKKQSLNILDFDDLILLSVKLLGSEPDVLKYWSNFYKYYLIDEFQDTNKLQFRLIWLLSQNTTHISVVGDPDQTIYSWRGADIKLINHFDNLYPNTKTITLNENYRSYENILEIANLIINNNQNRIKKSLITSKTGSPYKIRLHKAFNEEDQSKWIVKNIKSLISNENYNYSDIFVLYRHNFESQMIEKELAENEIPYNLIDGNPFFNRKEIKNCLALLKGIIIGDHWNLTRTIQILKNVGEKIVQNYVNCAEKENITLFELIKSHSDKLKPTLKAKISGIHKCMLLVDQYMPLPNTSENIQKFLTSVIETFNYKIYFPATTFGEEAWQNVEKLLQAILNYGTEMKNHSEFKNADLRKIFMSYFNKISLESNVKKIKNKNNYVNLMTLHKVKGLENKIVFITGLNAGFFPSKHVISEFYLEEERRLFYVGVTRAKEQLFLSYTLKTSNFF